MAEKKNQHFVPRFYLKYFSHELNGKFLSIYNIPKEKYILKGGLQGQASKDYFYGRDLVIEDALGEIESETSKLFNLMLHTHTTPSYGSEAHYTLLAFVLTLSSRTEQTGDMINETVDKLMKIILRDDETFKEHLNYVKIGYEHPTLMSLKATAENLQVLQDLRFKFIVNTTDTPFITSDHPVIKYNQFYERLNKIGGHTGFASKGLQIFFPMLPDLYMVFYDSDVYGIGSRKEEVISVSDEKDIEFLNLLQFTNAHKNIYFNEKFTLKDLESLKSKGVGFRKKSLTNVVEYKSANNDLASLLHTYSNDTKIGLKLTFVKELRKAKKYELGDSVVHYRNKELVDMVKEEKGRYF
ncbi:DUF4238 domain-containing protein [Paenibacillus macquariensis]|uniref:DUF4238 domain-containing protein n=1 Tax=Paenibacillus macquariensis TaxID=948756 RepID=A0ABY1JKD9_9BACL|nr:DUF4238 domain-containing protein [Paenibacillus macquariensis]MEC0089912.1 DUF4238 domain-containing protein [Paenibacillus macquariensis]OAB31196.1 hypothetical protein PMSM_20980 [Paenibacillus macquariensis subsp. macquariensis]SIQ34137.1 Protein of unknown function [Paenibacillus macquariensis]